MLENQEPNAPAEDKATYLSECRQTDGGWRATHGNVCAYFSTNKYGPSARTLAEDSYRRLLAGEPPYGDEIDDTVGRYNFPFKLAASQLGMNLRELRAWMVTGFVDGLKVTPPARAVQKDYIAGYELIAAKRRLESARANPPEVVWSLHDVG